MNEEHRQSLQNPIPGFYFIKDTKLYGAMMKENGIKFAAKLKYVLWKPR